MFRTWLSRSSPVISKSKRFPVVLPLLDLNSDISKPHSKFFSTDSPMGPFVGSDDHIVRVVNRNGNACRQARVHWLLASLVIRVQKHGETNNEATRSHSFSCRFKLFYGAIPIINRIQKTSDCPTGVDVSAG